MGLVLAFPGVTLAAPTATTKPAQNVRATSAHLEGMVSNHDGPTSYHFEYASEADYRTGGYTHTTPRVNLWLQVGPVVVPVLLIELDAGIEVTGLQPGTTYHFRIVVTQNRCYGTPQEAACPVEPVTAHGEDLTFTTPSVPLATTLDADTVTATGARLNGTANAQNGAGTEYRFEYCEAVEFDPIAGSCSTAQTTPSRALEPSDAADHAVSEALPEGTLAPATAYRFRLVVANGSGTAEGAYLAFTTSSADPTVVAPTVVTGEATSVTAKSATLNGLVNPNGLATTYRFELGTSPGEFTRSTAPGKLAASSPAHEVARSVTGLKAGTTYYFRLVAESAGGATLGAPGTFTTAPQPGKGPKEGHGPN